VKANSDNRLLNLPKCIKSKFRLVATELGFLWNDSLRGLRSPHCWGSVITLRHIILRHTTVRRFPLKIVSSSQRSLPDSSCQLIPSYIINNYKLERCFPPIQFIKLAADCPAILKYTQEVTSSNSTCILAILLLVYRSFPRPFRKWMCHNLFQGYI
jgi:hypothetical protein